MSLTVNGVHGITQPFDTFGASSRGDALRVRPHLEAGGLTSSSPRVRAALSGAAVREAGGDAWPGPYLRAMTATWMRALPPGSLEAPTVTRAGSGAFAKKVT